MSDIAVTGVIQGQEGGKIEFKSYTDRYLNRCVRVTIRDTGTGEHGINIKMEELTKVFRVLDELR